MVSWKLNLYHLVVVFIPETRLFWLKRKLLIWCGAKIGKNTKIVSSAKFYFNGTLTIGDNTWIGHQVLFVGGRTNISIGSNCDIAPRVIFSAGTHDIQSPENNKKIAGKGLSLPIKIGDGCWVCTGVTILGGAELDDKSLVAAQTLLLGKIYNSGLYMGVPANFKGNVFEKIYAR